MKSWKAAIYFAVAFLLQPVLPALFGFEGFGPSIILCLTAMMVFLYGNMTYVYIFTFITGLLYDICFGQYLGMATLSLIVVALGVLVVRHFFNPENLLSVGILSVIVPTVYSVVYWLLYHLGGGLFSLGGVLKYIPLNIIANGVVLLILYLILRKGIVKHKNDYKVR